MEAVLTLPPTTLPRILKSVERPHQQRIPIETKIARRFVANRKRPPKPAAVLKKLRKHHRMQRPSPVPGFVQARSLVPFRKQKAVGVMRPGSVPWFQGQRRAG